MKTRSKKKDTKLAGVRRAVAKKEVEVEVAKKLAAQHENRADQIEAVAPLPTRGGRPINQQY